ncbi:MAG: 4'-phosphopantetheinyl transferase family protein [Betaproteobacteria bacterium]
MPADRIDVNVHLFCLHELAEQTGADRALELLNDEDREGLARVRSAARRVEVLHGRAALKRLLADYADLSPRDVTFVRKAGGKPAARTLTGRRLPSFNISHSHGLLVVAVVDGDIEIGVDVERWTPALVEDIDALANSHFTAGQHAEYRRLPSSCRPDAFLRLWTLKEAVLKATGVGLMLPLRQIEFTGSGSVLRCRMPGAGEARHMQAIHLRLGEAWHMAVAGPPSFQTPRLHGSARALERLQEKTVLW